jgi:hypothetical protein
MSLHSSLRSFSVRISLALLALGLAAGCSRSVPPFVFNPEISVNVAPINPKWPKHFEDLTPAQQEVYTERKRPNLAHIQWSSVRDIMDREMAMRNMQDTGKRPAEMPFGWIYMKDKVEVVFPDATRSEVRPLSDGILAILEYGDPQQVTPLANNKGVRTEKWLYISKGVVLRFENGKRVKTDEGSIPAMPGYLGQ